MRHLKIILLILFLVTFAGCEKDDNSRATIRVFGDAYEDIAYSIAELDGDFVIAGLRTVLTRRDGNYIESSNRNVGLFRTGPTGLQKWEITTGTGLADQAAKVIVLPSGDIITVGYCTIGTGATEHTDIYIVRTDGNGVVIWESIIGGSGNQYGHDIVPKPSGGFMVAGVTDAYRAESGAFTENIAGMQDFFLLEIGETGDSIASYAFGYGGNDICRVLKRDIGGGYVMYGTTDNSSEPGLGQNNILLIRINEDASNRGAAIVGDLTDEYAADMEVLANGYLLAANLDVNGDAPMIKVMKLSSNIQAPPVFSNVFSVDARPSIVNSICKGIGGGFYLGGRIGNPTSSDMLIVMIDSDGEIMGTPYISGGPGGQEIYDITRTSDGSLVAAGKTVYENNSMMCLLKIRY